MVPDVAGLEATLLYSPLPLLMAFSSVSNISLLSPIRASFEFQAHCKSGIIST